MLSLPNRFTRKKQPPPTVPSLFPPTDPSVWCSPLCVHVFSLFNTCLWVRTCSVLSSVLVSVWWEWWFPDSSMFLQRTWTYHFLWLYSFHAIYLPQFPCPVYHQWAFGLVPGLCYCKQCCNEHSCTCVLIRERFVLLWIYTQQLLVQMEFLFLYPWGITTLSSTMAELIYTLTNSI